MYQEQIYKNSKHGEQTAEKAFADYLTAIDTQDFQFWDFEPEFLYDLLSKFWFAAWHFNLLSWDLKDKANAIKQCGEKIPFEKDIRHSCFSYFVLD